MIILSITVLVLAAIALIGWCAWVDYLRDRAAYEAE